MARSYFCPHRKAIGGLPELLREAGDCSTLRECRAPESPILADTADGVLVDLSNGPLPPTAYLAAIPTIGLTIDVRHRWHYFRRAAIGLDLLISPRRSAVALTAAGFPALNWSEWAPTNIVTKREIDLLVLVGDIRSCDFNGLRHALDRLAKGWTVVLDQDESDQWQQLLEKSRLCLYVGECNDTAEAAIARAGTVLLSSDALAMTKPLDIEACYMQLSELLEQHLDADQESQPETSRPNDAAFTELEELLEAELPRLMKSAATHGEPSRSDQLLTHAWFVFYSADCAPAGLLKDLEAEASGSQSFEQAQLWNALGVLRLKSAGRPRQEQWERALPCFENALRSSANYRAASCNLSEALAGAGKRREAIDHARRALRIATRSSSDLSLVEAPLVAGLLDQPFQQAWDAAAWDRIGDSAGELEQKRLLTIRRLHNLLAQLTGDLSHDYEAVLTLPDPATRVRLGRKLAARGQWIEASGHFAQALAQAPFNLTAARYLFQALDPSADADALGALVADRQHLNNLASTLVPAEDWFTNQKPTGDELVSIIICCEAGNDYSRKCLESLFSHTSRSFELILVAGDSTNELAACLKSVRPSPTAERIEMISNPDQLGFTAACNQALQTARGEYVVFLGNGTELTAGWLDGLLACLWKAWPTAVMVGPTSNHAPEPQGVRTEYRDQREMEGFADQRKRQYAGKQQDVERVAGFCTVARRNVVTALGGFDQRLGLDLATDDLCLRLQEEGYRVLVAHDVFIHHFRAGAVREAPFDRDEEQRQRVKLFEEKWGAGRMAKPSSPKRIAERRPKRTEPPQKQSMPPPTPGTPPRIVSTSGTHPPVSVTMIVKNEESKLPGCLASITGLVEEVVVVDTGSKDRTKQVALEWGAKVFEFPWVDSFAAARNEALRYATGKWILWLDADDRISEPNRQQLRALFGRLGDEIDAYVLKVRSSLDPANRSFRVLDQVRMFRNHPEVRWRYRVHEQILPSVRRLGGNCRWADVTIDHVGYQDPGVRRGKLDRNVRLLEIDIRDQPNDPFTLFNLGWSYLDIGKTAEALPLLRRSLDNSQPDSSIVRKLFALLVQAHRRLGQRDGALAACRDGLLACPDDLELLLEKSSLLRENGDLTAAENCLQRILNVKPGNYFASVDEGIRGYKTRHLLATMYREQGRAEEAEIQWRAALEERPDFEPAWLGLADLFLKQARWRDADEACQHLERTPLGVEDAFVIRGRMYLTRRRYAEAKRVLEEGITSFPGNLRLRVLLTHAFLQEGRDWLAAERALRDVLVIDPRHGESRRNLVVLLGQQGRPIDRELLDEAMPDELALPS